MWILVAAQLPPQATMREMLSSNAIRVMGVATTNCVRARNWTATTQSDKEPMGGASAMATFSRPPGV